MYGEEFHGDDFRSNNLRQRADVVRSIPLADVLAQWGADRDRPDRSRWHTERGPVSITGSKFFNWHLQQGGGGAIDLVMHLGGWDIVTALGWLERHLGHSDATDVPFLTSTSGVNSPQSSNANAKVKVRSLCLPVPHPDNFPKVHRYLTEQRGFRPSIIQSLITSGKLYADRRGNVVFPMVAGKAQRPIGAELRGTGRRTWRGLAPGTRKDAGFFWIGEPGNSTSRSKTIVLCE